MNIICAADDKYLPYCGIMLTSLFECNKDVKFDVTILQPEATTESNILSKIKKLAIHYGANIQLKEVTEEMLPSELCYSCENFVRSLPKAAYFRLITPNIMPEQVDKVLYLDCDIIINGSIKELYNEDISQVAVAAVPDLPNEQTFHRLGFQPNDWYFNSGVLLMNLKYWRDHHVTERCLQCLREEREKIVFHDQDTLNLVLKNEKKRLSVKYNFQTNFLNSNVKSDKRIYQEVKPYLSKEKQPIIIHFIYKVKPWHRYDNHPYHDYFMHFRKISFFSDAKILLPKRNGNILKWIRSIVILELSRFLKKIKIQNDKSDYLIPRQKIKCH